MEEPDVEETQVYVSHGSVDLLERLNNAEPRKSTDFPQSSSDGHARHLSEELSSLSINELRVNNNEGTFHDQFEANSHNHTRNFSADISSLSFNESHAKIVEENGHNQFEGKVISRHNSVERNIFKAAEIAERFIQSLDNRVLVDTAAPIESVKHAVNKFGGILDWKERRKHVQIALDKVREETPDYQRRLEVAELDKSNVLQELCDTRRIIEVLKLDLEKANTEAVQAQQDSELAEIRLKEIQQGIARKESAAVKAEIELAKERHETALADLKSVKDELEQLRMEHESLITQKEDAETKAHESNIVSQEIEKTVEDLTLRLISLRESLTSAHATHIIAEEQRINVALAYQEEKKIWHNELKQADEEVVKLNDEISASEEASSKLEVASALLVKLECEFTAYVEDPLPHMSSEFEDKEQTTVSVRRTLANAMKDLVDMRRNIEKAKEEVKELWNTAATLRADIENESGDLATLRDKEHHASISAASLKEDLSRMTSEITVVHERIIETGMPKELQQATKQANRAKMKAQLARDEAARAREEADRAKAEVNVSQLRLEATSREILAINASAEIALASASALQGYRHGVEIEPQADNRDNHVTLSFTEYDMLIKRAREAEDNAKKQITKAIEKIKEAKDAEVRSLDKLYQLNIQIDDRNVALKAAQERAIAAQENKLMMENELRKMRDKHEQESSSSPAIVNVCHLKNRVCSLDAAGSSASIPHEGHHSTTLAESKGRKSYFPRSIVTMFMYRRKTYLK